MRDAAGRLAALDQAARLIPRLLENLDPARLRFAERRRLFRILRRLTAVCAAAVEPTHPVEATNQTVR